ncbi:MAG: hypothetical protein QM765_29285 [Myxococcales bacterium]
MRPLHESRFPPTRIRRALATATSCRAEPLDRWKVESKDCEGDALTTIVVLEDGVVVVTVF